VVKLGEPNEVGRIGVSFEACGSIETSEGVTRESELIMPKVIRLHYEVEGILQDHATHKIKEILSVGEGHSPKFPTPPMSSQNLVISPINLFVVFFASNPFSLVSLSSSSNSSVASILVISKLGPSGFILIGSSSSLMATQHAGSLT
jgi:hypothetical protein